jgi:hypothetical protein
MQDFKNLYLASVKHLREIERNLNDLSVKLKEEKLGAEFQILDNADIKQLFHISDKTLSTWRTEGIIAYSKIKGKVYYDIKDIRGLLEESKVAFKKKE